MKTSGTYCLDSNDKNHVNHLRQISLENEGTFTAQRNALTWNESDDRSQVLGIYSDAGLLLSSMRVETIYSPEELQPKLDYDDLHKIISLPCGLLGKAATRIGFRGLGFNNYLRYLAYEMFYESNLRYVVGTIMPNADRIGLLKDLGYEFIENKPGWRRFGYDSKGPTLVCYLDLKVKYDHVMGLLEPKVQHLIEKYPYKQST